MSTTVPPMRPTTPAWLNLDAIVPFDLIAEADALVPESLVLAEAVTRLAAKVLDVQLRIEACYSESGVYRIDDFATYVDTLTGWEHLAAPWSVVEAASSTVVGGNLDDKYYASLAESMGLPTVLRPEREPVEAP